MSIERLLFSAPPPQAPLSLPSIFDQSHPVVLRRVFADDSSIELEMKPSGWALVLGGFAAGALIVALLRS